MDFESLEEKVTFPFVNENSIQHVSDTAHWIAHYRAVETARPDALFQDPLAATLAQARGQAISGKMGSSKIMAWSIALRTHIIDRYILDAVQDGVDTVVNLGAGLDTRPYRLEIPAHLKWIEADSPQVIDFKEAHLNDQKPRCELKRYRLDLADESVRNHFLSEINASSRKTLVLTEGVIIYLDNAAVTSLAKALAAQPNIRFWITDYFSPLFMKLYREGKIGRLLTDNIPFRFFPENWERFFQDCGWSLSKMKYLSEEGGRLGRPAPTPAYYRYFLRFILPAQKRAVVKRMTAYALLSR